MDILFTGRNYLIFSFLLVWTQGSEISRVNLECFDSYTKEQHSNALTYKNSHLACGGAEAALRSRIKRLRMDIDVEFEKLILAKAAEDMCDNMRSCNDIPDSQGFLQCYSTTTLQAAQTSVTMHFNASSLVVELSENEDYQKDTMHCTLQAKKKYVEDWLDTYQRHLQCLSST
uniref:Putative secreted protein n=1 Tax=Haematobia irritans TaxID=7368 RepID=A0A1L8EA84_HAEIR